MRTTRLSPVILGAAAVMALVTAGASWRPGVEAAGAAPAVLRSVTSRVEAGRAVLAIEASAPVSYSTSQPDARTFVVELRNVEPAPALTDMPAALDDVRTVTVERDRTPDGTAVARVRLGLRDGDRPSARSARNMIFVDAGRVAPEAVSSAAMPRVAVSAPGAVPMPGIARPGTEVRNALQLVLAPVAESKKYTGQPVSLDFQGADLRAVLRVFSEISGLNVVIDPSIQGTVDVALRDVPWDQALEIILRANRLGYSLDGTIVRIAPLTVLAEEETQRRRFADEQALSGKLQVLTRALSYAKAEDVAPLLLKTVLSTRGQVQTDARTNTLIINDLPERLTQAVDLITTLDQPQPQVEIEARIVQTTREFARTLGVQWGVGARASQALGNTLPLAFPNQGSVTGRTGGAQGDSAADAANTAVNLGVTGASSAIGLALGSVNGAVNLDIALSALERQGQGRLLSTPRVATQNNVEAEITQGVQIPIQTVANNTVTVSFKDAALTLKVTPQITAANTVIMRIAVENASPDFSRSVNNIPPIDTQRAVTQVLVTDGETTVIGGIYVSREQSSQDRTPGLSRIPLLGWLFKRDGVTDESRELLIFITPRIVRM